MAPPPPPPPRMLHSLLLFLPLLFLFFITSPVCSRLDGIRLELTHVDAVGNLTGPELLRRALRRSEHRLTTLHAKTGATLAAATVGEIQAPVHAGNGEFLVDLAIGTPPVPFPAIVDTGSDLTWTQCKPCSGCYDQSTPVFDPSSSATFSKLPCKSPLCEALPSSTCDPDCEYVYSYGDYSSTQGVLATETFSFPSASSSSSGATVPNIGFGCGVTNQGKGFEQGSGLVGLGRGALSLNSQLGLIKFSYCLTKLDENKKKSPLLLGSMANLTKEAKSTPLVKNPSQPSFYYLTLRGITVGKTLLSIPSSTFEVREDGNGGVIIDSGTSITYLEKKGYNLLKKALISQVKLPVGDGSETGLDLCFVLPQGGGGSAGDVEVPGVVFHFEGADMELPPENYMIIDSSTGQLCLTIKGSSGMSIFGNFQQQNFHILYDLQNEELSFEPAKCDQM